MGMTASKQDTEVMAEINITPFTDVLLVLLIIFMILAALSAPPGFQKQLPKKNNTPQSLNLKQLQHSIDVEVTAKNRVYVDRHEVPMDKLYQVMADTIAFHQKHINQGYNTHVSLVADLDANYNTIIKILDAARAAGDDDVGFVTQ
jgi:biopolymer transport protein ExbD